MGRAQGPAPARGGEAPGGPDGGPPAGVPRLLGRHPRRPVRRRADDDLGPRRLRARADRGGRVEAGAGGLHPARALPPGAHARALGQGGVAHLPLGQGARRAAGPGGPVPVAAPHARLDRRGGLRRPGLRVRAEVGRLPRAGARDLRRHRAAQPHRARPHAGVPGPARPAPGAALPGGGPRRRGGGAGRRGQARLQRPPERARPVHLRRLRPAARGRGVDLRPPLERAARAPGGGREPRLAAAPDAVRPRGRHRAATCSRPPRPRGSRASSPSGWMRPTGRAGGWRSGAR